MTKLQNPSVTCKASEPITGHGLILNEGLTENQIRKSIAALRQPITDVFIRIAVSPCGTEFVKNTNAVLYLTGLLDGLATGSEDKVHEYFAESSFAESAALIAISALDCLENTDKNVFGNYTDRYILKELLDFLTAWDYLLRFSKRPGYGK